jgi:manganese-dependent inorganic pyrophosphatase
LQDYLKTVQADKNIDMVFVMLTNILDETTELLCSGNNVDRIVNSAFRGILENVDGYTILPGVVSRKKQMVPPIIDAIQREDHS